MTQESLIAKHRVTDGKTPIHSTGTINLWMESAIHYVAAVKVYEFDDGKFSVVRTTAYWSVKNKGKWNEKREMRGRSFTDRYQRLGAALEFAKQWIAEKASAMGDDVLCE